MKSNIFIPKQINVGFQNRSDTYTKKLAYVIYFDHKGVLRKEASWNSWRDKEIDNMIHENVPTAGFVLNKKAGGYSSGWNHRQTYVRVYDPRGFEIEVSVTNLLYILENTDSIKGKGLNGSFVYGWDKTDLILIPTESPDYKEIIEFNEIMHNQSHIKGKELIEGATYLTKDNEKYVFLGKHHEYDYGRNKKKGKSFYFYNGDARYSKIVIRKTLGEHIIAVESEECAENYADLIDVLEKNNYYSPIDDTKDEYIYYTKEELEEALDKRWTNLYINNNERTEFYGNENEGYYYQTKNPNYRSNNSWMMRRDNNNEPYYLKHEFDSIDDILNGLKPRYLRKYLENGNLYSEDK